MEKQRKKALIAATGPEFIHLLQDFSTDLLFARQQATSLSPSVRIFN
jgi:hypothetical protein